MKYKISEIFHSVQGEGFKAGCQTVFVRMAGCSMGCSFCDTKYSWRGTKSLTTAEIVKQVGQYPTRSVTITGGEPFEQNMMPLVEALLHNGYRIAFETNGSRPIPAGIAVHCWITVSPKKKVLADNLAFANEVKFLVAKEADLLDADSLSQLCSSRAYRYLQPVSKSQKATDLCVQKIKESNSYRLSVQLHKYLKIR